MAKTETLEKVPLNEKLLLTVYEAAAYSGIGINRITSLLKEPNCKFVVYNGTRRLVKRKLFEEHLDKISVL